MDKQTPPDWVLIEAAKRSNYASNLGPSYWLKYRRSNEAFRALCDMIERYEQPPVDRKVLCAREAFREYLRGPDDVEDPMKSVAARAIELWEEGFGK